MVMLFEFLELTSCSLVTNYPKAIVHLIHSGFLIGTALSQFEESVGLAISILYRWLFHLVYVVNHFCPDFNSFFNFSISSVLT